MKAFTFERVAAAEDAARAVAARTGAMYLAGGTTLVDLMNIDVLTPDTVVDVRPLGLSRIDVSDDGKTVGSAVSYHTASGGHFAAWEQPKLLVDEMRVALKSLR